MSSERHFQYYIVKYVPDAASGTDVNIGVILVEDGSALPERSGISPPFVGVRFTENWVAVEAFASALDIEVIRATLGEIEHKCSAASDGSGAGQLEGLLDDLGFAASGVVLGPAKGLLTADPELALDELAARLI